MTRPAPLPADAPEQPKLRLVPAPSPASHLRRRHRFVMASFVVAVLLPLTAAALYLLIVAEDQYASTVAFSVHAEDTPAPVAILGAVAALPGGGAGDTDILYEYIQSQEMVARLDQRLDLKALYAPPAADPVFAFDPDGSIEDLLSHWRRKTCLSYDSGTGLIEFRALAFAPGDAQVIAQAVLDESSRLVDELSAIARADATAFAAAELDRAVERLKEARAHITAFRARTQIVDPTADIDGQMGLLTNLQSQLAEAYIQIDLLRGSTFESDIRIEQTAARIAVIEARIAEERRKLGVGAAVAGGDSEDYAGLIAEFERLTVDREFAEQAYVAALAAYDAALADARRKSRYVAPFVHPTLAETAQYPQRLTLLGLAALFLLSAWAISVLIFYSIRDRR